MLVTFKNRGDFSKTDKFFNRLLRRDYLNVLEKYGQQGVAALSASTPVKTGKTASSWEYIITHSQQNQKLSGLIQMLLLEPMLPFYFNMDMEQKMVAMLLEEIL